MSGKGYAADDVDYIAKRLAELEAEKQSVLSQPIETEANHSDADKDASFEVESDAVTAYWQAQSYDPWKKLAEDLAGKNVNPFAPKQLGPSQPVEPSGYTIIKVSDDEWKLVRSAVIYNRS